MNAHLANETRHKLTYNNDTTRGMIHILLQDSCLVDAGIDPVYFLSTECVSGFVVEVQTRYHASGLCEPWTQVFAAYVPKSALSSALIPETTLRNLSVFLYTNGPGGLFLSVPIHLEPGRFYDAFNVIAIRVNIKRHHKFYDILMLYEEIIPKGTRYVADIHRLPILCNQLLSYIYSIGDISPSLKTSADHLMLALKDWDISNNYIEHRCSNYFNPELELNSGGFDESPEETRIGESNKDIMQLIQRATKIVNSRHPIRVTGSQIASGLKQGAIGHKSNTHREAPSQAFTSSVLEPPGKGRFVNTSKDINHGDSRMEDILLITADCSKPKTPLEWFDVCYSQVMGGDTPSDMWRRRPISIVPRRYAASNTPLVVISYENSIAWGGRDIVNNVYNSVQPLINTICKNANVNLPQDLNGPDLKQLLEKFPFMSNVFKDSSPLLPFSPEAEVVLVKQFFNACTYALKQAIVHRFKNSNSFAQLLHYDIEVQQNMIINEIVKRTPDLVRCLLGVISDMETQTFYTSSLMSATLAYLSSIYKNMGNEGGYVSYSTYSFPCWLGNSTVYLFDYYSTGGSIIKLSHYPVSVAIEQIHTGSNKQLRVKFVPGANGGLQKNTCSTYLPGQCYAHICLGFNKDLNAYLVLPGGFVAEFDIAPFINSELPTSLIGPILNRFCRSVPKLKA
ncbi:unknown [Cercopithecine alphaherpesvirus 9]|uniref:Uncharacterized protein n=1 Tax=Cercopithecine herpesvirus 9 (strain DHV) TaxID=36348 RepID=Q9E1X6_CHV9D|nr:DNA packaging tegument protein UL17 [Cercopithecine alphaherpesvirus 9]AAG27217.1 unknown [Cercopithecine alphaherpesvirus 9]